MPAPASASSMRPSTGPFPTRSHARWVPSVSGASRRATPTTRTIACTADRSPEPRTRRGAELFLARLHLLHEVLERRRLDDLVELRAIVRDEADALDQDVV